MSGVDNYNWFGQSDSRSAQRNCSTVESDELCLKRSGQGVRRKENCVIVQSGYEQKRRRIHSSRFTCHALPPSFPTRATIDMCSRTLSYVQDMYTYWKVCFLQTRPVYGPQSFVSFHERLTSLSYEVLFSHIHNMYHNPFEASFPTNTICELEKPLGYLTNTTSFYNHWQ